jgi:hypothetical protein
LASHQESCVQKSNPFPNSLHQSFLDQVYERAKQRLVAAAQQAAFEATPASGDADLDTRSMEPLISGPELYRVLREPLAWLLSLAQDLAIHDPIDLAAVQRVRAATFARLTGRPAGLRATDVLTVFGLLVGALDPAVVFSAVSDAFSEGIAAVLGSELPVSVYIASTPDPRLHRRSQTVCTHPNCPMHAQLGR